MKLTIGGILIKMLGRLPMEYDPTRGDHEAEAESAIDLATADIQAYVKQEMRKIVVGVEFCNSDISAKGLQDKILTAIENYGKEK